LGQTVLHPAISINLARYSGPVTTCLMLWVLDCG
jgi:hypothetical protein